MKVAFLVSDKNGIYSHLARSHRDVSFVAVYDIRMADRFNETLEFIPVYGSYEKVIEIAKDGGIPVIAMSFLDEAFIKEVAAYGIGVFVSLDKERISDIIYSVGGG
ncbi:MAG: hypothetical protein GXO59_04520 [Dictyoglomi bacterium]|nr:hypothetical protein [Dictyoglomota bacterium]